MNTESPNRYDIYSCYVHSLNYPLNGSLNQSMADANINPADELAQYRRKLEWGKRQNPLENLFFDEKTKEWIYIFFDRTRVSSIFPLHMIHNNIHKKDYPWIDDDVRLDLRVCNCGERKGQLEVWRRIGMREEIALLVDYKPNPECAPCTDPPTKPKNKYKSITHRFNL